MPVFLMLLECKWLSSISRNKRLSTSFIPSTVSPQVQLGDNQPTMAQLDEMEPQRTHIFKTTSKRLRNPNL
jgi:hypothetical protein